MAHTLEARLLDAGFDAFRLASERHAIVANYVNFMKLLAIFPLSAGAILRSHSEKIRLSYRIIPVPPSQFHPSAF